MTSNDHFRTPQHRGDSVDCDTCPATGSTACTDCVVNHVLARDDGPIQLVPRRHPSAGNLPRRGVRDDTARPSATTAPDATTPALERAVERLVAAGLVVDTEFVTAPASSTTGVGA